MEGLWGLQGVMGEIVGNGNCVIGDLLENYWVLDSFGADLGGENCADGCCINYLQFVKQFWEHL